MTYDEESRIAQQVLSRLAGQGAPIGVSGARAQVAGVYYSVHRHGNDLRFHQQGGLMSGEVGRSLIVSVGEHVGGWMVARAVRPPGMYHDDRAAEAARRLVEYTLVQLGYPVGTPGMEGRRKTPPELEADVRAFLSQPAVGEVAVGVRRPAPRARRRGSRAHGS